MTTTTNIEPKKLAQYLALVRAQRERQAKLFATQFGEDSPAVAEVKAEMAELHLEISNLTKQAAEAPMRAPKNK